MKPTHYQVLQISSAASPEVVDAAWKALIRIYHPDGQSPDHQKAVLINQAHDILMDTEKRAAYDLQLKSERRPRPVTRPGTNAARAYPSPYPGLEFPTIEVDIHELAQEFVEAGGQAALDYLLDANPVLKQILLRVEKKKRRVK